MKTYLTENEIVSYSETLTGMITKERVNKLKELSNRYNIEFNHLRKTNLHLFYMNVINEIDALPTNSPFKRTLGARQMYWDNNDHSKGVELPLKPTIDLYMDIKGYADDYNYLALFDTSNIELFLDWTLGRQHSIKLTIEDLFNAYPNFENLLRQWDKRNADKEALKYTEKLFNIIEQMFQGEFITVMSVMPVLLESIRKGKDKETIFDEVHHLIHKNK
ncbi:MAG: hypothetical protein AB9834_12645 [Lentimicrobium sp.]